MIRVQQVELDYQGNILGMLTLPHFPDREIVELVATSPKRKDVHLIGYSELVSIKRSGKSEHYLVT